MANPEWDNYNPANAPIKVRETLRPTAEWYEQYKRLNGFLRANESHMDAIYMSVVADCIRQMEKDYGPVTQQAIEL